MRTMTETGVQGMRGACGVQNDCADRNTGGESLIPAGYGIQFAENEWDRYAGRGMDGMRDY